MNRHIRTMATLNEVANTESQFYDTKDSESILRFYARDMQESRMANQDGQGPQQYLAEMLAQINLGEPIGI